MHKPFNGKELYIAFQAAMHKVSADEAEQEWETIAGKQKKKAWNAMSTMINARIEAECNQNIADHITGN